MRVSRLMLVTLRDVPADAEIPSHQLLVRGGFIRRIGAGIYAYLPMMWRVLRKINAIVRDELDSLGALETLLPQLQPADLWERSGRWQGYTAGEGIMFHLEDRQNRQLGLGPTHEEVITELAGDLLRSYRQLPVTLYQIQTKFRDEIRPRFGLMRGREFIMKDAYSFHANQDDLEGTYQTMAAAYARIFKRCGLEAVAVDADSGAIGGAASQEYMVTAEAGEDLILTSSDGLYAANQEKATSLPPIAQTLEAGSERMIDTPDQTSIEQLCAANGLEPTQTVKVLVLLARLDDGREQPILVSLRGDQVLNDVKLANAVSRSLDATVLEISPISEQQLRQQGLSELPFGSIGPDLSDTALRGSRTWQTHFLRLADATALDLSRFVCGANSRDQHVWGRTWDAIPTQIRADLRTAHSGEQCVHDPSQTLSACRGIEVGHIFQLGRKYSEALDARFTNSAGQQEALLMGCYGIGISRLAQAAVEQHHDDAGICWPVGIAPFQVIVVIAKMKDSNQVALGEGLYQSFLDAGIDALLDDRDERAGVKFKDADLIGIPWRIVVGRDAGDGEVEVVERSACKSTTMDHQEAYRQVKESILNTLRPEI